LIWVDSGSFDRYNFDYSERSAIVGQMAEPHIDSERQQAHFLLDALPDEKIRTVRGLLEVMIEPLSKSLAKAPVEQKT